MAPNSIRSSGDHALPHSSERVELSPVRDVKRLMALRAALAALVAGLGALAAAATGDTITLQGWLVAASSAAAAAGAVYGVRPSTGAVETTIPTRDLAELRIGQADR